jgi:hypothetical protein
MVTATTMQVKFRGSRDYLVSGYISDVIGAKVKWNQNGVAGATSDDYVQFTEQVRLIDVSVLTGPTVMTGFNLQSGGQNVPGAAILISPNLSTNPQRSISQVLFRPSSLIGAVQF